MKKQQERQFKAARLLFVGYCTLMVYLLFIRGRSMADDLPYWEQVKQNCNLIPFRTVRSFWDILARPEYYLGKWQDVEIYRQHAIPAAVNLLGNIVMFIPLGCLLPSCFAKGQRFLRCMLTATGLLIAVELTQVFSLRGTCDVDDLILNLTGAVLGYGLWRLMRIGRCKKH